MQQMIVAPLQAEVEHDAGARRFVAPPLVERGRWRATQQFMMRPHGIAIRNDCVDIDRRALFQQQATHRSVGGDDFFHAHIAPKLDPQRFRKPCQRFRNGARSAHRIPHAFPRLHVRDAAKHRRRSVGRGPDILREMIDHLGYALIANVAAHDPGDAAARPHCEHVAEDAGLKSRSRIEHVAQPADGSPKEIIVGDAVEPFGELDEAAITVGRFRLGRKRGELLRHRSGVRNQVERRAVIEERAPLGVEPDEIERAREVASGFGKDSIQDARERQDRRAHIEAKPVAFENRRFAAQPVVALKEDDFVSARCQYAGRGEAAQSSANDADSFHEFLFLVFATIAPNKSPNAPKRCRPRPCAAIM